MSLSQARGEKGRCTVSLAAGLQEADLARALFDESSREHEEVSQIWEKEVATIRKLAIRANEAPNDVFCEASRR